MEKEKIVTNYINQLYEYVLKQSLLEMLKKFIRSSYDMHSLSVLLSQKHTDEEFLSLFRQASTQGRNPYNIKTKTIRYGG
jgi:hypothetical protein